MKVKVKNALMVYKVKQRESGRVLTETAFRGQIIELDDEQGEAKIEAGEAVPTNEELPRPGTLPALSATASAEEGLTWALAATGAEIEEALESDPRLRTVLEAARALAQERDVSADAAASLNTVLTGLPPEEDEEGDDEDEDEDKGPENAAENNDAETPVTIVSKSVSQVSAFLSHNPQLASEVLKAENALAEHEDRDPRAGVIRAVEAAAQHNE